MHQASADIKLYITLYKQIADPLAVSDPRNAAEFTPIPLSFTSLKALAAKEERDARKAEKAATSGGCGGCGGGAASSMGGTMSANTSLRGGFDSVGAAGASLRSIGSANSAEGGTSGEFAGGTSGDFVAGASGSLQSRASSRRPSISASIPSGPIGMLKSAGEEVVANRSRRRASTAAVFATADQIVAAAVDHMAEAGLARRAVEAAAVREIQGKLVPGRRKSVA